MSKKQFVVIGLGRFGESIAKTLYDIGNDVLVIDKNEEIIEDIADSVTHAVTMDATDENALKTLGLSNFDVAIVTIGDDLQSSILVTLLVKELGIKYIVAKARDDLHAKVLGKIGADKIILPEKDMGVRVAYNLLSSTVLDYIELSPDYSVMEFQVLDEWNNKTLQELNLRKKFDINVMAIKKGNAINLSPKAEDIISKKDILVVMGAGGSLRKLEGLLTRNK